MSTNSHKVDSSTVLPLTVVFISWEGAFLLGKKRPKLENVLVVKTYFNNRLRDQERIDCQNVDVIDSKGDHLTICFNQITSVVGFLDLKNRLFDDYDEQGVVIGW